MLAQASAISQNILDNDEESTLCFSRTVTSTLNQITNTMVSLGCATIFSDGDNILCKGENDNLEFVSLLKNSNSGLNFSVGIGHSIRVAYFALKYAKSNGKNCVVLYKENKFKII